MKRSEAERLVESSESAPARVTARRRTMAIISSRWLGMMLSTIAAAVVLAAVPCHAQSVSTTSFDHFPTGFPLTGTHASVPCASCHVNGRFENTPTRCVGCHNTMTAPGVPQSHPRTTNRCEGCHLTTTWRDISFIDHSQATGSCESCHNNNRLAPGKPANHVPTTAPCGTCHHNTVSFAGAKVAATPAPSSAASPATAPSTTNAGSSAGAPTATGRFTHAGNSGGCTGCHNGSAALGKPPTHIATNAPCETCHKSTAAFAGARMNHAGIIGACASCHNGAGALGKPATHIPTSAACESCHKSSVTFAGARMDHSRVAGSCVGCHNDRVAIGKPANHLITNAPCETCHKSTVVFAGARFDHAGTTATCAGCHNGVLNEGKPTRHFLTVLPCQTCHRTASWTPVTYRHATPAFVNHGPGVSCANCHGSNAQIVGWKFPAFRPDCAGCHVDKYRPMSHPKFERPVKVYYTIAELRDCTGACHTFADNTQRTILTRRSGVHRPAGGGW
jgi:hypothetical protein